MDLNNKVVASRIFLPQDAPSNLIAQYSIHNQEVYGTTRELTPGKWTNLIWFTEDGPEWSNPAELNLHIILEGLGDIPDNAADFYTGTYYVDTIELLELPDRYVPPNNLDTVLIPSFIADFRDLIVPDNLMLAGQTISITAKTISEPYERNVLEVDLSLPTYSDQSSYEDVAGGICAQMENLTQVYAIKADVLAPEGAETLQAGFSAIEASNGDTSWYWGGYANLIPNSWKTIFWSSDNFVSFGPDEQVHSESIFKDANEICIWIVTQEQSYEQPVYIDNIVLYELTVTARE